MSDRLEDVVDIALRVAEALEKVGAFYFVGGSRSCRRHAPRRHLARQIREPGKH
jgi:hypothetical protein